MNVRWLMAEWWSGVARGCGDRAGGFPTYRGCEFHRLREGSADRGRAQTRVKMSPPLPVVVSQFEAEVICRSYKPFYNPKYDAHDETQEAKELFGLLAVSSGSAFCRQLGGEVILLGWRAARLLGASRSPCDSRTLLLSFF